MFYKLKKLCPVATLAATSILSAVSSLLHYNLDGDGKREFHEFLDSSEVLQMLERQKYDELKNPQRKNCTGKGTYEVVLI
ncbi:hypothetical protein AVEN_195630-1 [Araneus ventricosus]|uniref:Uncharacterized protein n=1 Tax=Araneus ventricosus TaxID=182803 RepID=A0A4Y2BBZ8_ARAVE|nr:hypothetical protein AVEN_195630-1 [Araneus ventricosus]